MRPDCVVGVIDSRKDRPDAVDLAVVFVGFGDDEKDGHEGEGEAKGGEGRVGGGVEVAEAREIEGGEMGEKGGRKGIQIGEVRGEGEVVVGAVWQSANSRERQVGRGGEVHRGGCAVRSRGVCVGVGGCVCVLSR